MDEHAFSGERISGDFHERGIDTGGQPRLMRIIFNAQGDSAGTHSREDDYHVEARSIRSEHDVGESERQGAVRHGCRTASPEAPEVQDDDGG